MRVGNEWLSLKSVLEMVVLGCGLHFMAWNEECSRMMVGSVLQVITVVVDNEISDTNPKSQQHTDSACMIFLDHPSDQMPRPIKINASLTRTLGGSGN